MYSLHWNSFFHSEINFISLARKSIRVYTVVYCLMMDVPSVNMYSVPACVSASFILQFPFTILGEKNGLGQEITEFQEALHQV